MRLLTSAAVLALLSVAAPGARAQETPPLPSVTLPAEVERVLRDYERNWASGDEAALAALFTEDGFILQNGRPPVRGRANIQQAYANSQGPLRLRALAYAVDDSVGYIIGAYGYGEGDADMGKFVLALRRTPGGPWQIAADMDNGNQMPRRPTQPSEMVPSPR
ncbi:MAG TPA: nuclear transport factor 2 family protein [Longimicrobium sp.]|jgi:ketosteroid isomerase-like protein|nr:nuclear transport factor 2 family protein [Longimicrobium sp.]